MKKALLCLTLILLILAAYANEAPVSHIDRVWFDDSDNFFVTFSAYSYYSGAAEHATFSTSAGDFRFPEGYIFPAESPYTLNLNQEIPGFTIQRDADHFTYQLDNLSWVQETVSWGDQNDASVLIHPLTAGQSAVQILIPIDGVNGYNGYCWAKDIGTESSHPNQTLTSCSFTFNVRYSNGDPASGYPIYAYLSGNPDGTHFLQYTDENGVLAWPQCLAMRVLIRVLEPVSGIAAYDQFIFPEPGEHIVINVTLSEPGVPVPQAGNLLLHPSVLNQTSGQTIRVVLDSEGNLPFPAELRLFDLRGRVIARQTMPVSKQTNWQLPHLANGVYIIALQAGDRLLGRRRLTVIR